jgi:demethylmenaquinone methyltransferase/2-methoxy-6-polyprenyl-1,4-benzoquinol methylase
VDALFTGFWLSHVPRDRLDTFLALAHRWLRPGGTYAFIDSLLDPQSSAADHPTPVADRSVRRLDDGREFDIVKVYYTPDELAAALGRAGFRDPAITVTGRFFLLGSATA